MKEHDTYESLTTENAKLRKRVEELEEENSKFDCVCMELQEENSALLRSLESGSDSYY
jgi:predicted RNase H-like nuclease (RuvC/YqgF family)